MSKGIKNKPGKIQFDSLVPKIPFLTCLSEAEIAGLKNVVVEKHFYKNQVILYEEDTPHYLYFVYSGKVKAIQLSVDGQERILSIHKKGDFFGEMAILDGMTAPATIVAIEDTNVGFISKKDFEIHLLQNRKALMEIVALLCARLREAWSMLKVLSFADAEQRIRVVLKNIGDKFGVKDPRGTMIILKLSHKDIAELANTARETVTRSLRRFVQAGEIEILGKKYILLKPAFLKKIDP
jgi:CRP/FNR family transcriptional regulator, cyclic AMP receptor protein